jgi:hypothetical protein
MRIYLAGLDVPVRDQHHLNTPLRLLSYEYNDILFYLNGQQGVKEIFLDSGAFSAWNSGTEIKLDDLVEFITKYRSDLKVYAVLDVIGDADATLVNQKAMEAKGLTPLPCYHYGDDLSYLKHYMDNYEYIALGGMVPVESLPLQHWLDGLFSRYLCDPVTKIPRVKLHGFGMTRLDLVLRYPWYSVDSTSWQLAAAFGLLYVPRQKHGEWDYNAVPKRICVSTTTGETYAPIHLDAISEMEREQVLRYIHELGFELGTSEFFKTEMDYKPDMAKNEKRISKKAMKVMHTKGGMTPNSVPEGKKLMEVRRVEGVTNNEWIRFSFNAKYFEMLAQHKPYPSPFEFTIPKGFGFIKQDL